MSRWILDTDSLTLLYYGNAPLQRKVQEFSPDVCVTVISVEEQLTGWYSLLRQKHTPAQLAMVYGRLTQTLTFLKDFTVLNFDEASIHRYQGLQTLKLNVGKPDLRIAAIALEHSATVISRNGRDFGRVPGVNWEDWSAA